MIMKRTNPAALIAFTAAMLLPGLAAGAKLAPIAIRAAEKPLTTRVHEADKVFVAEVVNRKLLKDDWCHADLKVTQAIKGVKVGDLVPVVWRPKVARYSAEENQLGLAVLKPAHQKRYWLRADTFVDITFAEQAAYSLGKTDGILREYVEGAILTKEQEKIVIELANKRDIKKIAKITTYYRRPSSDRGISVYGVDQVKGREVLHPMLAVTYKDWTSQSRGPKKDDLQSGDFWAGKPGIRKTTILMVGKKEYRVGSPHGLSVEQCESILKRLQTGKYTLTEVKNEDRLKGVDWNSPKSFSKFGENINVSFRAQGGDGWYTLKISLTGDKLVIDEIMLAMP
jgi:hypothetical protein